MQWMNDMAAVSIVDGGRAVVRESRQKVVVKPYSQKVSVAQSYTFDGVSYDGPYEAVPSWEEQEFATANRVMREDFAVSQIVKLEAPNESGGLTLTI